MKTIRIIHLMLLALLAPALAVNPPGILNHQGRIAVNGLNYDGTGHFKFALVDGAGTTTYWSNDATSTGGAQPASAVAVPIAKGHYAVLLGDTTVPNMSSAIPSAVFTDHQTVALRLWFATAGEGPFELLSPDRRIAATGYALAAQQAEAVAPGGVTSTMLADGAVTAAKLASGAVTGPALAAGAVTSGAIADGSVTSYDLALGATGLVRKPVLLAEIGGKAASALGFTPLSLQLNPAGSLDPAFGAGGKVITHVGTEELIDGVAIQDDGKLVVVGHAENDGKGFLVGRYLENGSLDTAFGTGGFVSFEAPTFMSDTGSLYDVAILEDGRILVGGVIEARTFALAQFNPEGTLDTSFGTNGTVFPRAGTGSFDQTGGSTGVHSILVEDDGQIVLVGGAVDLTYPQHEWGPEAFAVVRCNPDGSVAARNLSRPVEDLVTPAWAKGGVLQSDGKIVMAGYTAADSYSPGDFALLRFNADLSIDSSFGDGGWVVTDMGGNDLAAGVALTPGGKILVAGTLAGDLAFARYEPTGALDTTFGNGGKLTVDMGASVVICAVRIDDSGRILVTGSRSGDVFLARLSPDGTLDASFGAGGVVTTDFGSTSDIARCVTVDAEGRIAVGGRTISQTFPMTERLALARYLGDAPWDGSTASVCVTDNIAYMVASGPAGGKLSIVNIADPASPVVLTEQSTPHPLFNLDGVRDVAVQGNVAFVVAREYGNLDVLDVSDPASPDLLASVGDGGEGFNQLGGAWSVAVSGTTAYVAALGDNALTMIDVSYPASPARLAEIVDGIGGFNHLAGARDVFVDGDTAYVTATNDHALTIIDVSNPAAPVLLAEVVDETGGFTKLGGAREVFVLDGVAYVTADEDDALTLIDVRDPSSPTLLAEVVDGVGGFNRLDGAAGVHVSGSIAMVTAVSDNAVSMIDISKPTAPVLLEETVDENGGFTKLGGADGIFIYGTLALVASNQDNALTILDLASPAAEYAGTVTNSILAPDAVTSDKILDHTIVAADLADAAVTVEKLADGAVGGSKLSQGGVGSAALAQAAVTGEKLADGVVGGAKLALGGVGSAALAQAAVTGDKLADGAVGGSKLAQGGVATAALAQGAVTSEKLAVAAVGNTHLGSAVVTGDKLADGAVGGMKLAQGGVASAALAQGAVTGEKLADGAVAGSKLAQGGVATAALAQGAVTGEKLADGAVAGSKLAQGGVATAALAAAAVTGDKLATGAVGTSHLGSAAVTSNKLATGSVTLDKLGLGGSAGQILFNTGTATEWRNPAAVLGDESPVNEIQQLSIDGAVLSLSNGGGSVNISDADADPMNELQTLSLDGNSLSLLPGGGSPVDLSQYFRSDGSQAFGGALNLNNYGILNVQSITPPPDPVIPAGPGTLVVGGNLDLGSHNIKVQSLTSSGGGTSPLNVLGDLKIFDGDLDLNDNEIQRVRKVGIGIGTPQAALHVVTSETDGPPVSLLEHSTTSISDQLASVVTLRTVNTNVLVDGFGAGLAFENKSSTSGSFTIARIGAARDGADELGALHFQTVSTLPEGLSTKMSVRADGNVEMHRDLYIGNVDSTGNDTIYFDRNGSEYLQWQNSQTRFMFSDDVWGTTFNPTSDRNLKEKFEDIDPIEVLDQVMAMPVTTWKFKEDDSAVRHIGPMAQDFHQAFGLGLDDRHISTTDADGVALAAIQALKQLLDDKDRKIQDLEARLQKLEKSSQKNR